MATIVLTIPDAVLPRVVDALCATGGREENSTVAKGVFAKRVLIDWVRDQVILNETRLAQEAARLTADAKARSEITIT
jgi:hypothetical protein